MTSERITTERARELLAGIQIRPTHDCCQYDYKTNGKIPCPCGYPSSLTSCGHQAEVHANYTARRALDAAAPDLAADLIAARERIAALEVERDEARDRYRFMVERAADASLDGYRELGARAAAAENERDGRVTVEEHARAVREAYIGVTFGGTPERWAYALTRRLLIATLTRHVGPERAAALVDGAGGGE